jgi:uncharacterized repeat protein (TIGR01451 family)
MPPTAVVGTLTRRALTTSVLALAGLVVFGMSLVTAASPSLTATGHDSAAASSSGGSVGEPAAPNVLGDPHYAVTIQRSVAESSYSAVGDILHYSFLVTNTGDTRIRGPVIVYDSRAVDEACPSLATVGNGDAWFDPGESVTCSASYTIRQGDLDTGSVTNWSSAQVDWYLTSFDPMTVRASLHPGLGLTKAVSESTYAAPGDRLHYSFTVTNSGDTRLHGPVAIDDLRTNDEACPSATSVGNGDAWLDPGEVITCSATHAVTQGNLDAGSLTNTATATADGITSNTASATSTAERHPRLVLAKHVAEQTYGPGDALHFTFVVRNSGNVRVRGPVTIHDALTTDEACPEVSSVGDGDGWLDVGESITCSSTYTATVADLAAGSLTNVAHASADGTDSDDDSVTVPATSEPSLHLVKSVTKRWFVQQPGTTLRYTFKVTNDGAVRLAGPVIVHDALTDDEACPAVTSVGNGDAWLDPGETITCSAAYVTDARDIAATAVTNTAHASAGGTDSNGGRATSRLTPTLFVLLDASASIRDGKGATIAKYNAALATWKARFPLSPYNLTLFNTRSIRERYVDRSVRSIPPLTRATFHPVGRTPLYDAVAAAIRRLDTRSATDDIRFLICTDGKDNESVHFTARSLARLIVHKERKGWRFVYLGPSLADLSAAVAQVRQESR